MSETATINGMRTQAQRSVIPDLERLKASGQPIVISINGQINVPIADDKLFAAFLDWVDRCETFETVKQAAEEVKQGRTRSLEEVAKEKRAKHGLPG